MQTMYLNLHVPTATLKKEEKDKINFKLYLVNTVYPKYCHFNV